MRKKRKKAVAVLVDGIVHAIGELESVAFDTETHGVRDWDALSTHADYPRRTTRAQRKEDRARALRARLESRVSLLCDACPHMISVPNGTPFRMPPWRAAPRTHAQINCMACLVALGRT